MVEAAVTITVAAMIDPLLPATVGRAKSEQPPKVRQRAMPAHAAKILTAGASATALFTMVAAMGWQSGVGSAEGAVQTVPMQDTTAIAVDALPAIQVTPSPTLVTSLPIVEPQAAAVPAAAVPVSPPPTPVATPAATVVVVPRAVAVATLPATKTVKHKSHTTTKTSG
jgi:hypothetical protein